MKQFSRILLIFGLLLFLPHQLKSQNNNNDFKEVEDLIRKVYTWHEGRLPSEIEMFTDESDDIYIGFNLDQLKLNVEELERTEMFADEFIDNYNNIYITLEHKIRNNEFDWLVGDLPPFGNGADPWCNCQDVPYDEPNPWSQIQLEIIDLNNQKGEFIWKWGGTDLSGTGWSEFTYRFRVIKENEKWKISYLEGFNFEEFTRIKF